MRKSQAQGIHQYRTTTTPIQKHKYEKPGGLLPHNAGCYNLKLNPKPIPITQPHDNSNVNLHIPESARSGGKTRRVSVTAGNLDSKNTGSENQSLSRVLLLT